MDFSNYDLNIDKIILACKVLSGIGEPIHKNRPSHGLAIHTGGEKQYVFSSEKLIPLKKTILFFYLKIPITLSTQRKTATAMP